jgi:hypothetical protein
MWAMARYFIRCRIIPVTESYFHVSAVAVQEGGPRDGVVARHHECDSLSWARQILEVLKDQVIDAVTATGGHIVDVTEVTS